VERRSFGQYQLLDVLGRGGMGQVFRAYDPTTDRMVALKVLPAHLAGDPEFQERFRREARVAASLNDPHVVPIHSYGEIEGRLYVDMRLIEGRDLVQYIAENGGRLSAQRAVAVIEQVAAALDSAHRVGLVHRDIKPTNILFATARDFVYLIDFGIARTAADPALTRTGHTMGTVAYMAPERFRGTTDHRADVYSLACVLYECLTGSRPYPGDSLEEQLNGHLNTPPPRASVTAPDVPLALEAVVARGMAKDVEQRYQTAVELAEDARAALVSIGMVAASSPPPPPPPEAPAPKAPAPQPVPQPAPPPAQRSNKRLVLGIVGGSVLALAGVAILIIALVTPSHHAANGANSAESRAPVHTRAPRPGRGPGAPVPPLPAFDPPVDLGANCQYPATPDQPTKPVNPPRSGKVPTDPPVIRATISTNVGDIPIELDNAKAPCTVNSFLSLAQQQFFNNTVCGKLITQSDFGLLQCGGPESDGIGGPGYQFADEYPVNQYSPDDPALKQPVLYPRGTLAMANALTPDTNQSQFNMFYSNSVQDPTFTVFGGIDEAGLATIDRIVAEGVLGNGDSGMPAKTVTINSVQLG
jgi:serine/threonine protein kinase